MRTILTAAELKAAFFDDVFYSHPSDYSKNMTVEQFSEAIDQYVEGSNSTLNDDGDFDYPSKIEVLEMHSEYTKQCAEMSR